MVRTRLREFYREAIGRSCPYPTPCDSMNAQSHAWEKGASGQNLKEECIVEKGLRGQPEMREQVSVACRDELKERDKWIPETEEAGQMVLGTSSGAETGWSQHPFQK